MIPDDSDFCRYCGTFFGSQNEEFTSSNDLDKPKDSSVDQEGRINKRKDKKRITSRFINSKRVLLFTIPIIIVLICGLLLETLYVFSLQDDVKNQKLDNDAKKNSISDLSEKYSDLQNDYDDLMSDYDDIESEYWLLSEKAEFLDSNIVFVVDNKNSKYYHCYDCDYYSNSTEYWAYNIELAEYLGHVACPYCH